MEFDGRVETEIGIFDLAISFSSDAESLANDILTFMQFYRLKCYHYLPYVEDQVGLNLYEIMSYVFNKTNAVIVLNSPRYCKTNATKFEYNIICERIDFISIFCIELGGGNLNFNGKIVTSYGNSGTDNIIQIANTLRKL